MTAAPVRSIVTTWRTPAVILVCGCLIAILTYGPRSSLGLFMTPLSHDNGWGRDVVATALAIQVLMWGVGQPLAGAIADRFGIAQLHQLRGRVGRGAARSYCYLLGEATTSDGETRLEAMVRTTDGFELAEVDLDLRGEGTIMGERQKGRNDLKLASLRRDREWVARAREVAFDVVGDDPSLSAHPDLARETSVLLGEEEAEYLLKS